jgi:hypothetical protein
MAEESYWKLLAIYACIDRKLAQNLVMKAASSPDIEIRRFSEENGECLS